MSQRIMYAYLKSHPLFEGISEQRLSEACTYAKAKNVYCGEGIGFGEGSYSKLYLLIQGKIKVATLGENGNELIRDILTAPDIFGDLGLDNSAPPDDYAEALTANTIVAYFNVTDFKKLLQDNAMMAIAFAR